MNILKKHLLLSIIFLFTSTNICAQIIPGTNGILYVKKTVSGGNGSGTSWTNAIPELADALKAAKEINENTSNTVTEIWVAEGTYYPLYIPPLSATPGYTNENDKTFLLVQDIKIYGGFPPAASDTSNAPNGHLTLTEARNTRNWSIHKTILSGDFNNNDKYNALEENENYFKGMAENATHVILSAGNIGNACLDGFIITGGNAQQYNDIEVNGESVHRGHGGGIYCASSSPQLANLEIRFNYSRQGGGGICNYGNINDRYSPASSGEYASPSIINTLIWGNKSWGTSQGGRGGGIYNFRSKTALSNVTIAGNTSYREGAGINDDSNCEITIHNSIIWGNTSCGKPDNIRCESTSTPPEIEYSLIGGLTLEAGTSNKNENPKFIFPDTTAIENRNYRLSPCSPAINAGNPGFDISTYSKDLDNQDRIYNETQSRIDMGAYEYQDESIPEERNVHILHVNKNATGKNDGTSWHDAYTKLADAVIEANNNPCVDSILVAQGTYKPIYDHLGNQYNDNETEESRNRSFIFTRSNLVVSGGYSGSIGDNINQPERDFRKYPVILSGNFNNDDTDTFPTSQPKNAYHIITAINSGNLEINGIFIQNGISATENSSINIHGETVNKTDGAGIYLKKSTVILHNVIIENNIGGYGAAIASIQSNLIIENSIIRHNTSMRGIINLSGEESNTATRKSAKLVNIEVSNNQSETYSGGIYIINAIDVEIINNTIVNNEVIQKSDVSSGGICKVISNNVIPYIKLANSILWGNKGNIASNDFDNNIYLNGYTFLEFKKNIIQGYEEGTSSIVLPPDEIFIFNPRFKNPVATTGADFTLRQSSRAINKGDNNKITGYHRDLAGNTRIINDIVDIGTYEALDINMWIGGGGLGTDKTDLETDDYRWSIPENWTSGRVPIITDRVEFEDHALNLYADSDGQDGRQPMYIVSGITNHTDADLIIPANCGLTLTDTSIPVAFTGKGKLKIEAGKTDKALNGTLILNENTTVNANVELYIKQPSAAGETNPSKLKWHYMGIPVQAYPANKFQGAFMREFDSSNERLSATNYTEEEKSLIFWHNIENQDLLTTGKGYEIAVWDGYPQTFSIEGTLLTHSIPITLKNATIEENKYFAGQNMVSNPFTAGLNVAEGLAFGEGLDKTIFIFNSSGMDTWANHAENGENWIEYDPANPHNAITPGGYLSVPQETLGSNFNIPSLQGFMIRYIQNLTEKPVDNDNAVLTFQYEGIRKNNQEQRVNNYKKQIYTKANLYCNDTLKDQAWLYTDKRSTFLFDNGYDGLKMYQTRQSAKLYIRGNDLDYQVSAVPDVNNSCLVFKPEKNENEYTLKFNHNNLDEAYNKLYLIDLYEKTTTDITTEGSQYHFNASEYNSEKSNRFLIISEKKSDYSEDKPNLQFSIHQQNNRIIIYSFHTGKTDFRLYNLSGQLLQTMTTTEREPVTTSNPLLQGIYIIKSICAGNETSKKIILH